jgi:hypothetical protein
MAKAFDVDTGGTLTTGLRAWFNFESSAVDELATYDGTTSGSPAYAAAKIGNGIDLESGSSQYVSIPSTAFPWTAELSISMWVKFETTTGAQSFMMVSPTSGSTGFWLYHDGTNLKFAKNQGAQDVTYAYTRDTNWHHIVGVSGASRGLEIWLDGTRVGQDTGDTASIGNPSQPVYLGAYRDGGGVNGFYLDGLVDLVGIWGKAITSTEITDLYNAGTGNAYRTQAVTTNKTLSVTASAVLAFSKIKTALKSLTQTASAVIALSKTNIRVKALAVTSSAVLSLSKVWTHLVTLSLASGATSSGPLSPGTTTDNSTVGTLTWSNPNNSKVSDNVYATAQAPSSTYANTHYIKATNYGFSVPSGAVIDGIIVGVERKRNSFTLAQDFSVVIVKADGSFGSQNKADTSTEWPTTDTYVNYGSSSDLWGETWTPADINDADFGVGFSAHVKQNPDDGTVNVDHIRITVHYTDPGGASAVVSLGKSFTKVSTLSVTTSAVLALSKVMTAVRSLAVTATSVPAISKVLTFVKSLSASAAGVISLLRPATIYKVLSATATALLDLVVQFITGTYSVALSVTASASVSMARTIYFTLRFAANAVLSLTKGFFQILAITANTVTSFAKTVWKSLAVIASSVPALTKGLVYLQSLAATAVASVTLSRLATHLRTLTATATGVLSLTKGLLYLVSLSVTSTAVAALSRLTTRYRTLSITATARVKLFLDGLLSIFSRKYPGKSGSYSEKFPANPGSYSEKYPSNPATYADKYPSP